MVEISLQDTFPIAPISPEILTLESGDRLSQPEFEHRYSAMPNTKAELIEGVVYVSSQVPMSKHPDFGGLRCLPLRIIV
jgi:hypothetical protein